MEASENHVISEQKGQWTSKLLGMEISKFYHDRFGRGERRYNTKNASPSSFD